MRAIIFTGIFMLCGFCATAQVTDTITVGFTKSAYLVFADSTFRYDAGSEDIIVRKKDDMLVVQAQVEDFEETNLFVRVKGKIYVFIVRYEREPKRLLYNYAGSIQAQPGQPTKEIAEIPAPQDSLKDSLNDHYKKICERMIQTPDRIYNRGIIKYKLGIYLRDLVISDDKIFMEFEVENKSNIPYIVDYFQYRVVPVKRRVKGESFQVIELKPLLEEDRPNRFEGKTSYKYVIVLDKFVLTENKKLVIEHWENNGQDMNIEGGRKINFDVFYKDILNVSR